MGSEASRTGYGSDAVSFPTSGPDAPPSAWHDVERQALLRKLHALEERARRLEYLETRLRDLHGEVQRLRRLADATSTLHAAASTQQLLDTALSQALELLGASSGSICLLEQEAGELRVVRAMGPQGAELEGTRFPAGEGVAGYVASRCEPLLVADIERDGRFPRRDSGRYATGSFIAVPAINGSGVVGVLTVSDRSDGQPFTERDLRTALRLAQDLAAAIDRWRRLEAEQEEHHRLVSTLAHELRNPLDGVLRFINLTLAGDHPEEKRRRYLMASKQGLERLTGIVNSLTGPCRGTAEASCGAAEVNDLIRQAVQLQEGKAEQRGIAVELALAEELPAVDGGSALFQVFTNLIANAYDAMSERGGTLSLGSWRENGSVVVRVCDTGGGIPPDVVERMFTPFFTTKCPGKGMGLGLAVCREIVGRLGGRIDVSSEPGNGTTFTVHVPCSAVGEPARP